MTRTLPDRPDISLLKKQAKKLLQQYRSNKPEAIETVNTWHPQPSAFTGLRDAQLVLARSYGFADWTELSDALALSQLQAKTLAEKARLFIRLACVQYAGDDTLRNYQRARRILETNPAIAEFDFYTALVANNGSGVEQFLKSDAALATKSGGPLQWPALLYVTYGRIDEPGDRQDSLRIAQHLLQAGADPNSHVMIGGDYRFTALTGAMGEGELGVNQPPHQYADELAKILLDAGANPNEGQGLYNTMFTDSADKWLKLLISRGLNAGDPLNWQATDQADSTSTFDYQLSSAVDSNRSERVKMLLAAGANPDATNTYNGKKIHTNALLAGNKSIARILAYAGASPEPLNKQDEFKLTCVNGDLSTVIELLNEHPYLKNQPELLHAAAQHCPYETVKQLIDLGFDIDGQTNSGRTLLHHYAMSNELEPVKSLLQQRARVDIRDNSYSSTAVGFAAYSGAYDAMRLLLDESDNLIDVASCAYLKRAQELLKAQPDLARQRSERGNTALHVIGLWLHDEPDYEMCKSFVDLLLSAGADLQARNNENQTPIEFREANGHEDMVELLGGYV